LRLVSRRRRAYPRVAPKARVPRDAPDSATRIWKQLLVDYEAPPLDPAVAKELNAFVAQRVAEGGAPER